MQNFLIIALALLVLAATGYVVNEKGFINNQEAITQEPPTSGTQSDTAMPARTTSVGVRLDLSGKGLTKVPAYVFDRTDVEELDLSGNALTGALPAEIRHLGKLKVLDLSNNKFTGVPAEIGQLKNLEILDLSENALTGLPYELGNLASLKVLDISGNTYSEADLSQIKKNLPSFTLVKTQ